MTDAVHIVGTGACHGDGRVASAALDRVHGLPPGSVERLTGVRERRYARDLDQIDMAVRAAMLALDDAGLAPGDLDAVLHAAAVPYQSIPATAPLVQRGLGTADGAVAAFDVNATCLGFLAAVQLAAAMVEGGRWRRALVACSEVASRGLDWSAPATAGLFGDGAGAAVIARAAGNEARPPLRVLHAALETHPSAYAASALVAGGTRLDHDRDADAFERHRRFVMDGRALFGVTRKRFGGFVAGFLARAGWSADDVDCVVPHQASPLALAHMARAMGVPVGGLVDICATHGNQISASLPIALDAARAEGRAGGTVLMLGTAAGVTFGAAALAVEAATMTRRAARATRCG